MQPDFHEIFDRFDTDEIAIRYIWQDGLVKGFFVGTVATAIICWCLS